MPCLGKGSISAGNEYTHTEQDNDFQNKEGILANSSNKVEEHTLSFFAEYGLKVGSVNGKVGVRYEHNTSVYNEQGTEVSGQNHSYDNLFPNVSLSFPLGAVSMNLSYGMKMQRPTYTQLDGNLSYVNRYEYMSGNPLLKPSKVSDVMFLTSYKFLQLTANWQHISDVIIPISTPYGNKENILYTSVDNFPNFQKWSVFLSATPAIGSWHPNYTIGLLGQNFHLMHWGKRLSLNRPLPYIALSNIFTFPWHMQVSIDGSYTGNGYVNTLFMKENAYMDMSVTQFFLKNKALSLKLQWNDVFNSRRYRANVYSIQSLLSESDRWSDISYVTLTVRYTFRSVQAQYKGTGAGNEEKARLK